MSQIILLVESTTISLCVLCVIMVVWWYLFRAGVLYQFNDAKERLPHMIVEAGQCVGCVRLPYTHRPHAFQVSQSLHKCGTGMLY